MTENIANANYLKTWEEVQNLINVYLEEILSKIEWRYGDCRSPFRIPPAYKLINHTGKIIEYVCLINLDLGDNESISYSASSPDELFKKIKTDIDAKYFVK